MARVVRGRLVLQDRALRVHAYRDARFFGRGAAWSLAALLLCGVLGVVAPWSIGAALGLVAGLAGALVVALGVAAALIWLAAVWGAGSRRASVRVTDALHVERAGRRLAIPLASICRARLRRSGRALTLATDGGVVLTLSLADAGEARRLLEAIAAGGAGSTWRARAYLPAPAWARKVIAIGAGLAVALVMGALALGPVGVALGSLTGITAWVLAEIAGWPGVRADLVVGGDGVAIRHDGGERFLPLARIAAVVPTESGVELCLTDGERLPLGLTPPALRSAAGSLTAQLGALRRESLIQQLHARLGHAALERGGTDALLERRGRPLPVWRASLRALVRDAAGAYRTAALSHERALEVLEDGRAPVELRVAAAMALSQPEDHRAARRLRVAIAASASVDVRAALEEAAEGELREATLARARLSAGEKT